MARSRDDYVAANRAAWNDSAGFHRDSADYPGLLSNFAAGGYSCLDQIATGQLMELGIAGKDVAQLCCNNGRELLSIKNLGAATCVGFDQSRPFLEQARELAAMGAIECRFVETDVYAVPSEFDRLFDIVVITIGVFGWMPDLGGFFAVVARLLKPGGALFVYEQHPIMNMFDPNRTSNPHEPSESYFRPDPFEEQEAIVYDGSKPRAGETHYWFVHTLADVITACLNTGFRLHRFREYPHNISSAEFDIYDDRPAQLPQSYVLIARKE